MGEMLLVLLLDKRNNTPLNMTKTFFFQNSKSLVWREEEKNAIWQVKHEYEWILWVLTR